MQRKFLKTEIKSYDDKATYFHDKVIPKAGSNHTCLAVIPIASALKKDGNYYPQALLKECKYTEKEKKVILHITEIFFSSNSDEEYFSFNECVKGFHKCSLKSFRLVQAILVL